MSNVFDFALAQSARRIEVLDRADREEVFTVTPTLIWDAYGRSPECGVWVTFWGFWRGLEPVESEAWALPLSERFGILTLASLDIAGGWILERALVRRETGASPPLGSHECAMLAQALPHSEFVSLTAGMSDQLRARASAEGTQG